jgi:hypothetical protein
MGFETRTVRALSVDSLEDIPADLELPCRHFISLLIIDDSGIDDERFRAHARRMIAAGAVFLCVWAPDSMRVRDIFDEVFSEYDDTDERYYMSAGREQRFEQMLWYFLYATAPAPDFYETCGARIAITVGSKSLSAAVHRYLAEPHTETLDRIMYEDMLAEDADWKRQQGGGDAANEV